MTPEQAARLQEMKDRFEKSWRRADDREASHQDVAYAKLETIEALAFVFGVDLKPY
jgi:hypothetical protein